MSITVAENSQQAESRALVAAAQQAADAMAGQIITMERYIASPQAQPTADEVEEVLKISRAARAALIELLVKETKEVYGTDQG